MARSVVLVTVPALRVGLTSPTACHLNDEVEFLIEVFNPGTGSAANLQVTGLPPGGMVFLNATGEYRRFGRNTVWRRATLAAGETWTLSVKMLATDSGTNVYRVKAVADQGLEAQADIAVRTAAGKAEERATAGVVFEETPSPEEPPEAVSAEAGQALERLLAALEEEDKAEPELFGDFTSPRPSGAAGAVEQFVVFTLSGTDYALPIANVLEIGRPRQITPLPDVPDWLLGLTNVRGDVISLVDLRVFLGLEYGPFDPASRMLVTQARGADLTIGLMVERVKEICKLPARAITLPPAPLEDQVTPYLRGVAEHAERLLVVLDLDRLLLSAEMRQFELV
jgi:purine-binding chemotaxis protein CheW